MVDKKIVLIGAGSAAFGPASLMDISSSEILTGSTIVLVDTNEEKLNHAFDILVKENEIGGEKFNIEKKIHREVALKDADFVIVAIENGERFPLRLQDNIIPRSHGTTEMMAENGGPGGFFHSARQIPEHVKIGKDILRISPEAVLIVYSNPIARLSLALKRAVPELRTIGLCHQIELLTPHHLSQMMGRKMEEMKVITGGLNHFAFILGLEEWNTGKNLIPEFNKKCWKYFEDKWDRFDYAELTFELYKRLGWFCYAGDNHVCEYVQVGSNHTKIEDIKDWLDKMDSGNKAMNDRMRRLHKRLNKGRYPKKGAFQAMFSGERGIPIIEAIIQDSKSYEMAVNIPNNGIIDNLPQDLVLECSAYVDKDGAHGVKLGNIPKQIAAILRIEATIQDLCVEAVLKESKELAIACLATDVNCGSFEKGEAIFDDMVKVQRHYLPNFR